MKKIVFLTFILVYSAFLAGCMSGGGSGGGFASAGDASGIDIPPITFNNTDDDDGGSGGSIQLAHNPEPSSLALLGAGLFGLLGARLRKRKGR